MADRSTERLTHLSPRPLTNGVQGVRTSAGARVALVNVPFAMADRPSIQCGLLKAAATGAGHDVDVYYLNLELAAEFGATRYHEVSHLRTHLLIGEWFFSVAAFGYRPDEHAYREARPSINSFCRDIGLSFEDLCRYRNEILPAWIDHWATAVDWRRYAVVGFTSTFEQNTAALALARAIKDRCPDPITVFGGANFDGEMGKEYVRALPWIDYVVVGEGDRAFPELLDRVSAGERPIGVPGVFSACDGAVVGTAPGSRVDAMDDLPDPDYDEFFETLFRLGVDRVCTLAQPPLLLIETGRGCWWGQKHHCTFCGLNANGMRFRAKSPKAALEQVRRLSARYRISNFEAVDNILDYRYIEEVCVPLGQAKYDYRFFYEVKANLKREQLRTMARAGITRIQPGIESLSSHVLELMHKGISMLHNVRCLKWAHYYGMRPAWNILMGFPGETERDYEEQLRIMPLLRHLPPPGGCGPIWLERFSPYFFDTSFPVTNVDPLDAYHFIYPSDRLNLGEIAYFFEYEMGDTVPPERHRDMQLVATEWRNAWGGKPKPELVYQRTPDWIQVFDRRTPEVTAFSYDGLAAAIYEYCGDTDRTEGQILTEMEVRGTRADSETVRSALGSFLGAGIMLEEKGRFLSLALPVNRHW